ncbi:MAG: DUF4974 domain-containing protein [Candidatus Symbiothrix sp.]|jgi:ferric-dicitrate binding protein FerR (iron transport regulator)|nr:DUF4974 domain-containing protein [Candidatus Symbiothrix sp.]
MNRQIISLFRKYISGTITGAEESELLTWIGNNPQLQQWGASSIAASPDAMPDELKEKMLNTLHTKIRPSHKHTFSLSYLLKIAALILLILGVGVGLTHFYYSRHLPELQYVTVESLRGQKSTVELPDGSKVFLNSGSKLIYSTDYNHKDRTLYLSGEAYFEVAKNADKPFVVNTEQMNVHAVGTAFNISAYPEDAFVRATLAEGKVKVVSGKQTVYLNPNEQANFNIDDNTLQVSNIDDAKRIIGWMNNQLYFENAPLDEIAARLSRIYNVNIIISSEKLRTLRFSGTIGNNSLESIFRIISLTAPVRYEIHNNQVRLF